MTMMLGPVATNDTATRSTKRVKMKNPTTSSIDRRLFWATWGYRGAS